MPNGFELLTDAGSELIEPYAPVRRKAEVRDQLKQIHQQFIEEQRAGLSVLERNWRAWTTLHLRDEFIDASVIVAEKIREGFSSYVHVGIGGSDLGPRVCHEVLDSTLHNELPDAVRPGPRVYFTGDTFDPRPLRELLDALASCGELGRTAFNIVSRSGKTAETLCAFLVIKDRLGADWMDQVVFTTGPDSLLLDIAAEQQDRLLGVLPVPEGVGGRFSVPSPVGLVPLAVTAGASESPRSRIEQAMAGYAAAHDHLLGLASDADDNFAFRLAYLLQLAEEQVGLSSLVLYDYSACRMLGDWLVQLYTESIQERGEGLNIIAARGPTSNHSLLNGIVGGPRDKVVLFLRWGGLGEDLDVPTDKAIEGGLEIFMNQKMMALQEASCQGCITDFAAQGIPSMELRVPGRDASSLFYIMRVLMDTVAIKGRLQGLHIDVDSAVSYPDELTYLQFGVEGYKEATRDYLESQRGAER